MKAVILAGGHATRLWPITKNRAKPLLPLGNRPIIDYIVEELENEAEQIIISTNKKYSEDFKEYGEEYSRDVTVAVENQSSEDEKPGTIGAILNMFERENLDLEDDLIIIGGDNYYSFHLPKFLEFSQEKEAPTNVVYDVSDKEIAKNLGVVDTDGEKIIDFVEKPEQPPSTLASTAVYFFPKKDLSLFKRYEEHFKESDIPRERYLDEPGRLIEWAHRQTDMYAYSFSGEWFDIGTPEGYLNATASVTEGKTVEGEVHNSEISENTVVMEGATVKGSEIQDSIIFPGAKIKDSSIKNTIVDSKAKIKDKKLNKSVIGSYSNVK